MTENEQPVRAFGGWSGLILVIPAWLLAYGVQLRREVLMSSISDYFERMHRKEHLNPSSHWFTIGAGILFILAGAVGEIRTQDLSRALPYVAIGLGMTLFGVSHVRLRESRWGWLAFLAELALWFGGVYWLVRTMF